MTLLCCCACKMFWVLHVVVVTRRHPCAEYEPIPKQGPITGMTWFCEIFIVCCCLAYLVRLWRRIMRMPQLCFVEKCLKWVLDEFGPANEIPSDNRKCKRPHEFCHGYKRLQELLIRFKWKRTRTTFWLSRATSKSWLNVVLNTIQLPRCFSCVASASKWGHQVWTAHSTINWVKPSQISQHRHSQSAPHYVPPHWDHVTENRTPQHHTLTCPRLNMPYSIVDWYGCVPTFQHSFIFAFGLTPLGQMGWRAPPQLKLTLVPHVVLGTTCGTGLSQWR